MKKEDWFWVGKYLIVVAVALVLGAVLGVLKPFQSATIGSAGISAGSFVRFIAHSGALALLWSLGYRCSQQLRRASGQATHLATTVRALMTLIVVASAYGVLSRFITPFEAADLKPAVAWTFIVGILLAAGWLLWALFADSEAWLEAIGDLARRRDGLAAQIEDRARG